MKIVKHNVHLVFSVIFFLITFVSWGQTAAIFSGGGTGSEKDPYVILTNEDWDAFANSVNAGNTYENEYIKLGNDIGPITTIVGICNEPKPGVYEGTQFDGNFDGAWHTINIDIKSDDNDPNYTALFAWVNGAIIRNLTVTGKVTTTGQYTGGIVSCYEYHSTTDDPIIMKNCTSKVEIISNSKETHHGGLVGWICSGYVEFENCIFEGKFTSEDNLTDGCAGFVGLIEKWSTGDDCHVAYKNCIQAYEKVDYIEGKTNFGTFHLPKDFAPNSGWTTAYCINRINNGDSQGTLLTANSLPKKVISRKYTRTINGVVADYYVADENAIPTPSTKVNYLGTIPVRFYERRLHHGVDYSIAKGVGKITISGIGNYAGSVDFDKITYNPFKTSTWEDLKSQLSTINEEIDVILDRDYIDEKNVGAWVFNKGATVHLDLNGYNIDRRLYNPEKPDPQNNGYVIKVSSGATLEINDNSIGGYGAIIGGCNNGSSGGIYNLGTVVMNSGNIAYNYCVRTGSNNYGCGGGVFNGDKSSFTMNGGSINRNVGDGGGGGVYTEGSTFKITGGIISHNMANSKGGGIRVKTSIATISDCDIIYNKLNMDEDAADAGGLYIQKPGLKVTNCRINGNKARRWGGGIYVMDNADITLTNCEVSDNTCIEKGGGIYIHTGKCSLISTIVTDNVSNTVGGIWVQSGQTLEVAGKTIVYNNIGDASKPNVYLVSNQGKITITGNLTGDPKKGEYIGLSKAETDKEPDITSGFNNYTGKECIKSDNYKKYWFKTREISKELYMNKTVYWGDKSTGWVENDTYTVNNGNYVLKAPVIIKKDKSVEVRSIKLVEQGALFLLDGGQLAASDPANEPLRVNLSVIKTIKAAAEQVPHTQQTPGATGGFGWYTISSPVNNPKIGGNGAATNLITAYVDPYNFDLLRWVESENKWDLFDANYVNTGDFTRMENGRGYIYRNQSDIEVNYQGETNSGVIDYKVTSDRYRWHLLGNPYTHELDINNVTPLDSKGKALPKFSGYYILTNNTNSVWGDEISGKPIAVGLGFLVQVPEGTAKVRFTESKTKDDRANREYVKFIVNNDQYEDAAYALYDEGYGLRKIEHLNPEAQMLYINYDGEDYAVATLTDDVKTFNLNFRSMTAGQYTLKYETQGEFDYLHVYDKLTGRDIDMLANEEYKFISSPKDTDSRFVVNLKYKPNYNVDGSGTFAYQEGEDILVTGEGHLQMFDVAGRMIVNKRLNGVERISVAAKGVYILKLNEKTQKIVVR